MAWVRGLPSGRSFRRSNIQSQFADQIHSRCFASHWLVSKKVPVACDFSVRKSSGRWVGGLRRDQSDSAPVVRWSSRMWFSLEVIRIRRSSGLAVEEVEEGGEMREGRKVRALRGELRRGRRVFLGLSFQVGVVELVRM